MTTSNTQYLAYLERHRTFVRQEAEALDIEERGRCHDLSKYSQQEFPAYADYFYGDWRHTQKEAPAEVQAAFDLAWLSHQKNKDNDHHWQWWVLHLDSGLLQALPMSEGALREMLADWRGAGRAISGQDNTVAWYLQRRERMVLHPQSRRWIESQLGILVPGAD